MARQEGKVFYRLKPFEISLFDLVPSSFGLSEPALAEKSLRSRIRKSMISNQFVWIRFGCAMSALWMQFDRLELRSSTH